MVLKQLLLYSNGVCNYPPPTGQGSPYGTGAINIDGTATQTMVVIKLLTWRKAVMARQGYHNIADNSSSLTNGANIGDLKKVSMVLKADLDFAGDKEFRDSIVT